MHVVSTEQWKKWLENNKQWLLHETDLYTSDVSTRLTGIAAIWTGDKLDILSSPEEKVRWRGRGFNTPISTAGGVLLSSSDSLDNLAHKSTHKAVLYMTD